jgi:hypothetical protein
MILESSGSVYLRQRTVPRGKVRMVCEKFVNLPDGGGSVASDQAASIQVAIRQFAGMLHGKNLVFLGQFSQVTFDPETLYCVLIELVDEQFIRITLAKRE